MTLVLADTSVWVREHQARVAAMLAVAIRGNRLAMVLPVALELLRSAPTAPRICGASAKRLRLASSDRDLGDRGDAAHATFRLHLPWRGYHRGPSPVDLLAAAAAESVDAELWHCDRHFELIAEVTGQPMRRLGE